jgi:hypothetical protein
MNYTEFEQLVNQILEDDDVSLIMLNDLKFKVDKKIREWGSKNKTFRIV